jgi:hypothetical protein
MGRLLRMVMKNAEGFRIAQSLYGLARRIAVQKSSLKKLAACGLATVPKRFPFSHTAKQRAAIVMIDRAQNMTCYSALTDTTFPPLGQRRTH